MTSLRQVISARKYGGKGDKIFSLYRSILTAVFDKKSMKSRAFSNMNIIYICENNIVPVRVSLSLKNQINRLEVATVFHK